MCVIIDVNGEEFHVPDEITLDSNNVRETVQRLEAEDRLYKANRMVKRKAKRKMKKNILERIFA